MMAQTSAVCIACVATVLAAAAGFAQPPARGKIRFVEPFLFAGALAFGLGLAANLGQAIGAATLFPGVYYAFGEWKNGEQRAKKAFHFAFGGAAFFLYMTCHDIRATAAGALLVFGAPPAAEWLTKRTNQRVGLTLITLAVVFQLTRVQSMLFAS